MTATFTAPYRAGTGVESRLYWTIRKYGGRVTAHTESSVTAEFEDSHLVAQCLKECLAADEDAWLKLYGKGDEWEGPKKSPSAGCFDWERGTMVLGRGSTASRTRSH